MDLNNILEFLGKFEDTDKIGEVKESINKMMILEDAKSECPNLTGKYVKETYKMKDIPGNEYTIIDFFKIKSVEVDRNGNYLDVKIDGNTIRKFETHKEYSVLSGCYLKKRSISVHTYKEELTIISKNEYDSELGRAIKYLKNGLAKPDR